MVVYRRPRPVGINTGRVKTCPYAARARVYSRVAKRNHTRYDGRENFTPYAPRAGRVGASERPPAPTRGLLLLRVLYGCEYFYRGIIFFFFSVSNLVRAKNLNASPRRDRGRDLSLRRRRLRGECDGATTVPPTVETNRPIGTAKIR